MRTRHAVLTIFIALLAPAGAGAQEFGDPVGENLVANPSFEDIDGTLPAVWWFNPGPEYSSDATQSHDGARSVKIVDTDGSRALFGQSIDLLPGRMYAYEAWIKTEGLDGGARLCIEWSDAGGDYLGGDYRADDIGGTADWTRVAVLSSRVPLDAAGFSVSGYMSGAQIGTAWWDAFSVRRAFQRPIYSLVTVPSYRGWIFDDGPDHLTVRYLFTWDDVPGGREAVFLQARLTASGSDETLAIETADTLPEDVLFLDVPLPALDPGDYLLKTELVSTATGDVVYEDLEAIERRTGAPPAIHVDPHGRLIVDGEPFFPLGMYWSGIHEDELQVYTEAPFNAIMPYSRPDEATLDLALSYGIRVIYSIKDFYYGSTWCPDFITSVADEETYVRQYVQRFRDHPALIGWYLNDERPLSYLPRLESHYRWVKEEDDGHPAWIVHFVPSDFYIESDTFDVLGADPYPITHEGATVELAGRWARETRESVAGARGVWMVPQAFAYYGYAPSQAQMRSMAWQCIAEGAMGLIFYSWFDMRDDADHPFAERWPELTQVAEEISAMIPVLLSVEPAPSPTVTGPGAIHWTVRRSGDIVYLVTASDSDEAASATVLFPDRPDRVTLGGTEITLAPDGSFAADLEPLGVNIYEVTLPYTPVEEGTPETVDGETEGAGDIPPDAVTDTDGDAAADTPGEEGEHNGGGDGCGCRLASS